MTRFTKPSNKRPAGSGPLFFFRTLELGGSSRSCNILRGYLLANPSHQYAKECNQQDEISKWNRRRIKQFYSLTLINASTSSVPFAILKMLENWQYFSCFRVESISLSYFAIRESSREMQPQARQDSYLHFFVKLFLFSR